MDSESGKPEKPAQPSAEAEKTSLSCPACGTTARRVKARFCSTCGRALEEHYLPADALRASYHQHRRASTRGKIKGLKPPNQKRSMSSIAPTQNRNGASTTALAFATYALVPYLGILFCPGAILIGSLGLIYSYRAPQKGGRRTAFASIVMGIVIFGAQILLWWIISKVPEWSNPGGY